MQTSASLPIAPVTKTRELRLRRHADYQRVYRTSRKQFSKQMSYFFSNRPRVGEDGCTLRDVAMEGPRVGLTVGKVMGKAVDRNRIKRRMREAVRRNLFLLRSPLDVVLHPRRSVIDLDFETLSREVAKVFQSIQHSANRPSSDRVEAHAGIVVQATGTRPAQPTTKQTGG